MLKLVAIVLNQPLSLVATKLTVGSLYSLNWLDHWTERNTRLTLDLKIEPAVAGCVNSWPEIKPQLNYAAPGYRGYILVVPVKISMQLFYVRLLSDCQLTRLK